MRLMPQMGSKGVLRTVAVVVLQAWLGAGGALAGPFEDMEALRKILVGYRDQGLMQPVQWDMQKYLNRDVKAALDMARTMQGDECTRAVRLVLFLDAHRTDLETMGGRLYDTGLPEDLGTIWIMPDKSNVVAFLFSAWKLWVRPGLSAGSINDLLTGQ